MKNTIPSYERLLSAPSEMFQMYQGGPWLHCLHGSWGLSNSKVWTCKLKCKAKLLEAWGVQYTAVGVGVHVCKYILLYIPTVNWAIYIITIYHSYINTAFSTNTWAACAVVIKLLDLNRQGWWFDPWCGHNKIYSAVRPLSKAFNPGLLQGICLLLSLINCKSLWIKTSAKWHVILY